MIKEIDCVMCVGTTKRKAEIVLSWPASVPQRHAVCLVHADEIWKTIIKKFIGTEAYYGFTVQALPSFCDLENNDKRN